jgi:hypothetical protein
MDNDMRDTNTNDMHPTLDIGSSSHQEMRASKTNEMRQWAEGYKVNKPIPSDLLLLLAKDEAKQMKLVMKNMSLENQTKEK